MENVPIDISIVVTVYNVSKYLDEFFDSIAAQSYKGFRLVMVDDCATDDSYGVAESRGTELGERFVLLKNPHNMGLSGARNTGLDWVEQHPTKYITFLDPDDWIEANYLEDLHTAAEEFDVDLSIAGMIRYEDGTDHIISKEMVDYSDQVFPDSSKCDDLAFINPCVVAKLFRFEEIKTLRFRTIKRSEDTCYLFEALPSLKSIKFTNNPLYHYRIRRDSLSGAMGEDKYLSMHEEFAKLLPQFSTSKYVPYREMFETQVFIRSSVGGVTRIAFGNMHRAFSIAQGEKIWLDTAMPTWRKNKYLSFGRWNSKTKKQLALKICASMYKANIFVAFIFVYYFISNILKKEVRA